MTSWVWLETEAVQVAHLIQLGEFGGPEGRNPGGLESALSRPCNLASYGEADAASLAAAYAYRIARNHPFADGNKRMAWLTANMFLAVNHVSIAFDAKEASKRWLGSRQVP
jgi:death-on-curing protein